MPQQLYICHIFRDLFRKMESAKKSSKMNYFANKKAEQCLGVCVCLLRLPRFVRHVLYRGYRQQWSVNMSEIGDCLIIAQSFEESCRVVWPLFTAFMLLCLLQSHAENKIWNAGNQCLALWAPQLFSFAWCDLWSVRFGAYPMLV